MGVLAGWMVGDSGASLIVRSVAGEDAVSEEEGDGDERELKDKQENNGKKKKKEIKKETPKKR